MFHHFNHRGDVVLITDGGGEIVKSLNYGAYGDVIGEEVGVIKTGPGFDSSMPEVFSGAYGIRRDTTTGLDYMRFRWYAKDLSSFISADRVRGTNRYAYAKGNPVKYVDPMGLKEQGFPNVYNSPYYHAQFIKPDGSHPVWGTSAPPDRPASAYHHPEDGWPGYFSSNTPDLFDPWNHNIALRLINVYYLQRILKEKTIPIPCSCWYDIIIGKDQYHKESFEVWINKNCKEKEKVKVINIDKREFKTSGHVAVMITLGIKNRKVYIFTQTNIPANIWYLNSPDAYDWGFFPAGAEYNSTIVPSFNSYPSK